MKKKTTLILRVCLFLACCFLFLFACTPDKNDEGNTEPEELSYDFHPLDTSYEEFQKIVGWLSEETILVHLGNTDGHKLTHFNILTGESSVIYEEETYLLSIDIHLSKDYILFQEVQGAKSNLKVIHLNGEVLQDKSLEYSGYVSLDWNPMNHELIFVSYYMYDFEEETDTINVFIWDIGDNSFEYQTIQSLSTKWYSANIYLYVDELETGSLYIGDTRDQEADLLINQDISEFFLHEDTFIGLVESDILDNQVHLFHEYPLLVSEHTLTIPKVTMNDKPVQPHLTQSQRNGKVYAVLPSYSFSLEEELGEYMLSELNFKEDKIIELMTLPEDAPLLLSPDERFLLYGWRYEALIDLETNEIIPLLENTL